MLGELTLGGDGTAPPGRLTEGGTLSCDGVGSPTNGNQMSKFGR